MHPEEIGARTVSSAFVPTGAPSLTNESGVVKWPVTTVPLWCQVTYGVLPENVMSARSPVPTGWPPLAITNRAAAPAPTSRATNTSLLFGVAALPSSHTIHGTVGLPAVIVPAATRGSSASFVGSWLTEHCCSAVVELAQLPNCLPPTGVVPLESSTPNPLIPTAVHWNWPSAAALLVAFAANTISLLFRPTPLAFCSYHTTHGTVSLAPVNAMSGSTPSREGSTFIDGSLVVAGTPPVPGSSRSMPTCWKQNPPFAPEPAGGLIGLAPSFGQVVPLMGFTALLVKIWFGPGVPPSSSCQVTHGTGSLPATVAPPWITGLTASRLVWMFNDGTGTLLAPPLPRPCPAKIHLPWLTSPVLSNLLAKMLSAPKLAPVVCSYQLAHGTIRPAPAKSIEGASPSWVWSKFSEPLNRWVGPPSELPPTVPLPRVVQVPAANERLKIWSLLPEGSVWRKIAHGTNGFVATSEPPTTSEFAGSSTLTGLFGSIPAAGSLLT